ncbi:MAG: Gfo/Idh/MocA family oxidoreductase [Gemmatimonadota bacterium]|nr:Gfo/Idh/MocA family oxidoreductase [Gemmatimonadota bacterium]
MSGIRMGVVGAGALGFHHVRILRELPGIEFVGFHESRTDRGKAVSDELGVRHHDTLDTLLDAADALTIVVPTPAHHAVAKAALVRGKHVLIEKPIASTIAEADDLLAAAAASGAIIQTGHVERFNRAIRAALPVIDRPRFIESDRLAPFTVRGSDVAVVLDLMIHDIDLIRTLVGGHITELSAVGVPVLTPFADIANARIGFDTGAVANITASRVSRERMRKLRIFQQSGYLSLDLAAGNGDFYRMRGDIDPAALMTGGPVQLESFVEHIPLEAPAGEPLRLEFESFIGALQGTQPVTVTGEDGREALAVALRIMHEIERSLPSLSGASGAAAMAGRGAGSAKAAPHGA